MGPPYLPAAVANEFLDRSGRAGKLVTPMQLQKLVYIAHGWNLATSGLPLFEEKVQAWKYGPVIPSLFYEFKEFGGQSIQKLAKISEPIPGTSQYDPDFTSIAPFLPPEDEKTIQLIDWVWNNYGHLTGPQLSNITHRDGTPWKDAVKEMKKICGDENWILGFDIEQEKIREHYIKLWGERRNKPVAS